MPQITLTLDFTPENFDALRKLAEELAGNTKEEILVKSAASKPKTSGAKKTAPPAEEKTGNSETTITLTEVRAVALKLSQSGKQTVLQGIFAKFGAKKLSDVPQEDYPALMEELEAAANG